MPSQDRRFKAGVPVLISHQCIDQATFLENADVRQVLLAQLARAAVDFAVAILAWAIRPNHLHLVVTQDFDGQPRRKRKSKPSRGKKKRKGRAKRSKGRRAKASPSYLPGISNFMRQAMSRLVLDGVNPSASRGGSAFRGSFKSRNCVTVAELIQRIAYVGAQDLHHAPDPFPTDALPYGTGHTFEMEVDGVMTTFVATEHLLRLAGIDAEADDCGEAGGFDLAQLLQDVSELAIDFEAYAEWEELGRNLTRYRCRATRTYLDKGTRPVADPAEWEAVKRRPWAHATHRVLHDRGLGSLIHTDVRELLLSSHAGEAEARHRELADHWRAYRFPREKYRRMRPPGPHSHATLHGYQHPEPSIAMPPRMDLKGLGRQDSSPVADSKPP